MLFASLGGLLVLVGAIWLIVIAIQTGESTGEKVLWAVVNFLCQPLGGIIFYIVKRQGLIPLILVIVGSILLGFGNYSMMGDAMYPR
jgi:cytochrome c oxidase assembly factor CtaG